MTSKPGFLPPRRELPPPRKEPLPQSRRPHSSRPCPSSSQSQGPHPRPPSRPPSRHRSSRRPPSRPLPRLRLVPTSVGREESWTAWLRGTYAMVWYMVGVMAACLFALIELKERGGWPWTGIFTVIVIIGWGSLGMWWLWPDRDR